MREQRRLELEAEECTFQPSLGGGGHGGGGGGGRRGFSAEPRNRRATTGGLGVGPPGPAASSFSARSTAFLEAREHRLNKLRKEKIKLELQEATFHPAIGSGGMHARSGSGSGGGGRRGGGGGDGNVSVATAEIEAAVADGGRGVVSPGTDIGAAQVKEVERKGSVEFKVRLMLCVFF